MKSRKRIMPRRLLQRLDTHHGLFVSGLLEAASNKSPNSETMMRFYNQQHRFYCGVDLHARTLAVCILDTDGTAVFHDTIAASPQAFLKAVQPYRDGLAVACECMFAWYWLADLCHEEE